MSDQREIPDDILFAGARALGIETFHAWQAPWGDSYWSHVLDANSRVKASALVIHSLGAGAIDAGVTAIAAERGRQLDRGYTIEHDHEHHGIGLLEQAAQAILADNEEDWPFDDGWKPGRHWRERMVVAGALIAAAVALDIDETTPR